MRHLRGYRRFARTSEHRKAMLRNLAQSLFEHGRIRTTVEKAKELRPFAEKLITLARKGTLHHRRLAYSIMQDRDIWQLDDAGEEQYGGRVLQRLFTDIGPRFKDRNGGYTRIIKLSRSRPGDNARMAVIELLDEPAAASAETASA